MGARRPPEPGAAPHPLAELAGYTSQQGGWHRALCLELENSGSCSTSRFPILVSQGQDSLGTIRDREVRGLEHPFC